MSRAPRTSRPRASARRALRTLAPLLAATLGIAAALLVASCGGSGKGLIPVASAGPLQGDVDAVEAAAKSGNGNCAETETALLKLDQDFAGLPTTLDGGLRNTLRQGISNLRSKALELCAQPLPGSTNTTTTTTTQTTTTPPAKTETTTTPTTPTTPSEEEVPAERGGTPAPGEESEESESRGRGNGPGGEGPPGQEGK